MKCEQNISSKIYEMETKWYHLKYMKWRQNISSEIYEIGTKCINKQ